MCPGLRDRVVGHTKTARDYLTLLSSKARTRNWRKNETRKWPEPCLLKICRSGGSPLSHPGAAPVNLFCTTISYLTFFLFAAGEVHLLLLKRPQVQTATGVCVRGVRHLQKTADLHLSLREMTCRSATSRHFRRGQCQVDLAQGLRTSTEGKYDVQGANCGVLWAT